MPEGLLGKLEGKWPLGIPRCRWLDNIIINPKEMGWIDLAQNRDKRLAFVYAVVNL
jgi:hypothetical protein